MKLSRLCLPWLILTVIFAVGAALCGSWPPTRFGALFFGGLAIGTGVLTLCENAQNKPCKIIAAIGKALFAVFLVSLCLVMGIILSGEKPDPEAENADYILVLGGGLRGDRPAKTLALRLDRAHEFLEAHPDSRVILCGGQGPDEIVSEADAMKNYLVQRGVQPDRLLTEKTSTSTIENIENARQLYLDPLPEKPRTAVISSEFHLARARQLMAASGLDPYGLPSPTPYHSLSFVYHLREYCSVLGLIVTGRWQF